MILNLFTVANLTNYIKEKLTVLKSEPGVTGMSTRKNCQNFS